MKLGIRYTKEDFIFLHEISKHVEGIEKEKKIKIKIKIKNTVPLRNPSAFEADAFEQSFLSVPALTAGRSIPHHNHSLALDHPRCRVGGGIFLKKKRLFREQLPLFFPSSYMSFLAFRIF